MKVVQFLTLSRCGNDNRQRLRLLLTYPRPLEISKHKETHTGKASSLDSVGPIKYQGGLPHCVTLNQDLFHFVTEKINLV